ncbi:SDR family oxidoreductase [uncultured Brevundimonas sp.]|uniref:NAD-dependent epimerase/dehydratase family protein n=1 Tax=uncultured Brevundimonas sp. TaxID=213418 RepID=UPI0030EB4E67|tara:strand:- start:14727 stop:15740 length:1014 start_codon:yes stop_codon:yes gene_type:complete
METRFPEHRRAAQAAFERALGGEVRLAVTGATGWLGSAVVAMALRAGIGPGDDRLRAYASRSGEMETEAGSVPLEALDEARPLEGSNWVVWHFAALGKERTAGLSPEDFVAANTAILNAAFRLMAAADHPRMVYSSSGAVHGAGGGPPSLDQDPYGHVKGLQERAVLDWCSERGIPLVLPRVFNVGGPHGNKLNLYALSSLAQTALAGDAPVVAARGPVFRSYVHIEELIAVLAHLVRQSSTETATPFDTAGREVVEIGDLAARVCEAVGLCPADMRRDYDPVRPASWYVGDARTYQVAVQAAGLTPIPLSDIVADTLASLTLSSGGEILPNGTRAL